MSKVWAETAPDTPFDARLTWRDAGVDSLKTLHFLLRLEQVLGRPVSFDLITRDMTLGDLVLGLSGDTPAAPSAEAGGVTVFLVPGVFGDEAPLAEFRRSLVGQVQFDTLVPPDIDQPASLLADMKASARFLTRVIVARQPEGPLYLAGYSIGGMLAFQAANDLAAMGRQVGLVCLLDSLIGQRSSAPRTAQTPIPPAFLRREVWAKFLVWPGETPLLYAERVAFGFLVRIGLLEFARRIALASAGRHDVALNAMRRRRVLGGLRRRAIAFWRPRSCAAPVLLIASDDFARQCRVEAWAALCPDLTVQRVSGGHTEIFEPAGLADLKPALLKALRTPARPTLAAA